MSRAFIALGSNIEPRMKYLETAIELMAGYGQIQLKERSFVYETEPVGFTSQGDFLNMVIELETPLSPEELLDICQEIEWKLGRKREIKWGPRTIDLDILLYNQENIETERLTLPHPGIHERAFVLIPLADIDRHLFLFHVKKDVSELLKEISSHEKEGVKKWQQKNGETE